ncbi:uncharacterized protein RCC_04645 [Ramularia collo-cygni]|uniref:Uncharacterized protein n=1 Tax=Ramularia collo-cygni TaxID=112498 RepID=A0A2D3URT4_9PEZI|nr:uncharacterized protein RCC_04645 [Ramularia collo-cygni]CZT18801.1 uncharacterized protein RCC_04645 [Ramularia collo-cygni]
MVNFGPVYSQATTISVLPNNKKRMVDGYDKESHHGSGSMVLLTPPASPNTDAARGRADPFNCYNNVEWQPWFDKILHHVVNIYAPRGWPALKVTREQGMKWEWFLTQKALAEPALFYVRLLFGSGDLIVQGGLPAKTRLWLRAQAIKHINEALGDPRRACSDALILAVGRIALHEHMYGDREASVAIHRPAQRRMVEMRGGMKALEFPEVVKRAMKWSDHIMAVGTHTEEMLNEEGKEQEVTVKESIKAIESYAPYLMPRVRTQIRVDELLNED